MQLLVRAAVRPSPHDTLLDPGTPTTYSCPGNSDPLQQLFAYDERNRLLSETTTTETSPPLVDDWTAADDQPWDASKWATSTAGTADVDIAGNEGRLSVSGSGDAKATASQLANAEVQLTYRFEDRGYRSGFRVALRAEGTPLDSGYRVDFQSDSATVKVRRISGGTDTKVGQFTYTEDTNPQRLRFLAQNGTIKVKLWAADTSEPAAWTWEWTDPNPLPGTGFLQLHHNGTSGTRHVYVDDLTLTDLDAPPPTPTPGKTYTWSPRGTLRSTQTGAESPVLTSFDAFDRLISDASTTYSYDSLDRLSGRNANVFNYAGLEKEPVGDGGQSFSRSPNGEPLALRAGTTSLAVRRDLIHDDLTATFTPSGSTTTDSRAYDPFGSIIATVGTTQPALGYQAQWTDPGTNKVAMQARWYDGEMGGFASRDSWNNPASPSAGMNRYGYGNANPLVYADTNGHAATLTIPRPTFIDGAPISDGPISPWRNPLLEPKAAPPKPGSPPGPGLLNPGTIGVTAGLIWWTMDGNIASQSREDQLILQHCASGGAGYWCSPTSAPAYPAVIGEAAAPIVRPAPAAPATSAAASQTGGSAGAGASAGAGGGGCRCRYPKPAIRPANPVPAPAPSPVEVPIANLKPGEPPKFSVWANPLNANPLAGVTQAAPAVNQTVVHSGQSPEPGGAPKSPDPGPNLEALRERARGWLNDQNDPCAKDFERGGRVVWSENNCGPTGAPGLRDPARGTALLGSRGRRNVVLSSGA